MAAQNTAASEAFLNAAIDPKGAPDSGVPDGDTRYTTIVRDKTVFGLSAYGNGSFAAAGFAIMPSIRNLVQKITAVGATSSGTLSWAQSQATQTSNITTDFVASRLVGIRYRVFPRAPLSTLNGTVYLTRWPSGEAKSDPTWTLGASITTPDIAINALQTRSGPVDDPLADGWTDFFVGSAVSGNESGGSDNKNPGPYGWVAAADSGNLDEGMSFIWVGTASTGNVNNDPLLWVEINSMWECMVPLTANGLWPATQLGGDPSGFARAIEALLRLNMQCPIVWKNNAGLLSKVQKDEASERRVAGAQPGDGLMAGYWRAQLDRACTNLLRYPVRYVPEPVRELLDLYREKFLPQPDEHKDAASDHESYSDVIVQLPTTLQIPMPSTGPRPPTMRQRA